MQETKLVTNCRRDLGAKLYNELEPVRKIPMSLLIPVILCLPRTTAKPFLIEVYFLDGKIYRKKYGSSFKVYQLFSQSEESHEWFA